MAIAKWKIAELAAYFLESAVAGEAAQNVTVEHDAKLPDRQNANDLRQVDVVVRYSVAGQAFVRAVEVQDRGAKVGSAFIDQVVTKGERVGAHRITLVSIAGFTGPALRRIEEESHILEAVRLSPLRFPELPPMFQIPMNTEVRDSSGVLLTAKAEHFKYHRLGDGFTRYVAVSDLSTPGTTAALAQVVADHQASDMAHGFVMVMVKPGSERGITSFKMGFRMKDGTVHEYEATPRAPRVKS
jgi:hypothetical protein